MSDKPKDSSTKGWWWFIIACGLVVGFWLLFLWIVPSLLTDDRQKEIAAIASPLESLFAGLAFAGVIIAILQQKEELALQREELRQTREEMEQSTQALNDQAELNARVALLNHFADQVARGRIVGGEESLLADQVELLKQKMETMGIPYAGRNYQMRH